MGQETSLDRRHGSAGKGTALGKVRGLGASRGGTHHWLLQRFTAAGNLISVLYLLISFLILPDLGYGTVTKWIGQPVTAAALVLMIVSVFWHMRLGVTVMIEDYLDAPGSKFAAVIALNLAAFAGAGFAIVSIARIALVGAA